jgi:hypothetical protein
MKHAQALVLVSILCTLAAWGSQPAVASTTTPFRGMSAQQILLLSLKAASNQHSVKTRMTVNTSRPQENLTVTSVSGQSIGEQTVVGISKGLAVRATVIVINRTAYLTGNAFALADSDLVGLSKSAAAKYAGAWIYGPTSRQPFTNAAENVTYSAAGLEGLIYAPFTISPVMVVDGQQVVGIHGRLASGQTGVNTSGWLYVSVNAPHLPVRYGGTATVGNVSSTGWTDFSAWNEPVHIAPPKGAIAYS